MKTPDPEPPLISLIAPHRLIRGRGTIAQLGALVRPLGRRPLVIGGGRTLATFGPSLEQWLATAGLRASFADYGIDCTAEACGQLVNRAAGSDVIIGLGGGKALDMAKLVACQASLPVVTVPTSAATCAAWAALSNVYSAAGTWQYGVELPDAPNAVVLDYDLIASAPLRTLVAGMGDALAKWYEASVSSGQSSDPLVIAAVSQARVLRDLILQRGEQAVREPFGSAWEQMVDASICLAGTVGGLGGARCRTVAAHALHNALTALPGTRRSLHGEKVAYGILVQLRLEETVGGNRLAPIAREQLEQFYQRVGLPVALSQLGLGDLGSAELHQVAVACCVPGSDIHHLPFTVTPADVLAAIEQSLSLVPRC